MRWISELKVTKNRHYDYFLKKIKIFSKKVLTKEESFGKIIFADAPKGTNPKAAEAEMNLDN